MEQALRSMNRDRCQALGKRWTPSARAPEMAERCNVTSPESNLRWRPRAPECQHASAAQSVRVAEREGSDHPRAPERQGKELVEHRSNRGSEAPSTKVTKRVEPEIRIHENKRKGRTPGKPSAAAAEGQTTQAMERPRSGEELAEHWST